MFPNEPDFELEDEMERDRWAVDRQIDPETGEITSDEREMFQLRIMTARQILERCEGYDVA